MQELIQPTAGAGPQVMDRARQARNLFGFFVLTYALTWIAWLVSARLGLLAGGGPSATGGPLFLLGVFAPAPVALGLTWHDEGRDGVVRLLARISRWRVAATLVCDRPWLHGRYQTAGCRDRSSCDRSVAGVR